ncbi:unnamed protein product [Amoebophrya sp. A25]|nr:unnamed protein product [Amoebophrya sp. A25]|eukprot:GSA25T00011221001.1
MNLSRNQARTRRRKGAPAALFGRLVVNAACAFSVASGHNFAATPEDGTRRLARVQQRPGEAEVAQSTNPAPANPATLVADAAWQVWRTCATYVVPRLIANSVMQVNITEDGHRGDVRSNSSSTTSGTTSMGSRISAAAATKAHAIDEPRNATTLDRARRTAIAPFSSGSIPFPDIAAKNGVTALTVVANNILTPPAKQTISIAASGSATLPKNQSSDEPPPPTPVETVIDVVRDAVEAFAKNVIDTVIARIGGKGDEDVLPKPIPDATRNASELIVTKNYPLEFHKVTTEDGYILTLFRIPHGRSENSGGAHQLQNKDALGPPVLLQHGLLDSCATWVVNGPDQSLAFILADKGFDVWLGNTRGSTWSLEHVNLTTIDSAYWDFSFDDIAKFDTPAVIDYISKTANSPKVGYAGHSQGTLQMFLALSMLGEKFQSKIAHYSALAPVGRAGSQQSLLITALIVLHVDKIYSLLGNRAFLPNKSFIRYIAGPLCNFSPLACEDLLFLIVGEDSDPTANLNKTRVPVMVYNSPGGTSVKNMVHWADLVRRSDLTLFDYGFFGNLYHYGSVNPPAYDLTDIANVNISLYSGGRDALADPADVALLVDRLRLAEKKSGGTARISRQNYQTSYQHLDFTWGMSCGETIYPLIVEEMQQAFQLAAPPTSLSTRPSLYRNEVNEETEVEVFE